MSLLLLAQGEDFSTISGTIYLNFSQGDHWINRPLILHLENVFQGTHRQSQIEWVDPKLIEEREVYFERRIIPGSYSYFSFINHDQNPEFSICTNQDLGDFIFSTQNNIFSIKPNDTLEISDLFLEVSNCSAQQSELKIILNTVDFFDEWSPSKLRICFDLRSDNTSILSDEFCFPFEGQTEWTLGAFFSGPYNLVTCVSDFSELNTSFSDCISHSQFENNSSFSIDQYPQQIIEIDLFSK